MRKNIFVGKLFFLFTKHIENLVVFEERVCFSKHIFLKMSEKDKIHSSFFKTDIKTTNYLMYPTQLKQQNKLYIFYAHLFPLCSPVLCFDLLYMYASKW